MRPDVFGLRLYNLKITFVLSFSLAYKKKEREENLTDERPSKPIIQTTTFCSNYKCPALCDTGI